MEDKETLLRTFNGEKLLTDNTYFKYIFKKTEKIACTVFYAMRHWDHSVLAEELIKDIKQTAKGLLSALFLLLRATPREVEVRMFDLKYQILELDSMLRLAHSSALIDREMLGVFLNETDSVLRSLKKYISEELQYPFDTNSDSLSMRETGATIPRQATRSKRTLKQTQESQESRRERILTFLKDKGEASIKDVAEVITDCSEKTIQRDLNNLIKDNLVMREGDKRWSKYRPI